MSYDQWRQVLATNLDSIFLLSQAALSGLANGGSIVNISSIEGLDPAPGHGHYATSKGRDEHAYQGTGTGKRWRRRES